MELKSISIPVLLGISTIVAISIVGLGVGIGNIFGDNEPKICETPDCIITAARLLRSMDRSADPCDDFHRFACGDFQKNFWIPDDSNYYSSFSKANDELDQQLKKILENNTRYSLSAMQTMKIYYDNCMDENYIDEHSEMELKEKLQFFGGWPLLESPIYDNFLNWDEMSLLFSKAGFSDAFFISVAIGADDMNISRNIIYVEDPDFGLPIVFLKKGFNNEEVKHYFQYMVDIAVQLGANRNTAEWELESSLKFEIALANISLTPGDSRNRTKMYNPISLSELNNDNTYRNLHLQRYVQEKLSPHIQLHENDVINVVHPEYLHDLYQLLKQYTPRTKVNYAMWRIVEKSIPFMGVKFRDINFRYLKAINGQKVPNPRWKDCLNAVQDTFGLCLSSLYVSQFFNSDDKTNAITIIENLQENFKEIISQLDWMDTHTKKAAVEKLQSMRFYIGYPDELLDNSKLEAEYANLRLYKRSYYNNFLTIQQFLREKEYRKFREMIKPDWKDGGHVTVVNAFYDFRNSLIVPAGILQGIFYSKYRPAYANYGIIGSTMGHELIHGFDDVGSQFDGDGNLVNWWSFNAHEDFLDKTKCIIEQYGNYTVEEINLSVNGINTLGENIADMGGLKVAYLGYQKWAKVNEREFVLPGYHSFTPQQMFWISYASNECMTYTLKMLENLVINDEHSPAKFRINGPLSNLPEFSEDFKCPSGSNMNPIRKCNIW